MQKLTTKKLLRMVVLTISLLVVNLLHPGLAYPQMMKLTEDTNQSLVNLGATIPLQIYWGAVVGNCGDTGCGQSSTNFSISVNQPGNFGNCGIADPASQNCTISLEGEFPDHATSVMMGNALAQFIQKSEDSDIETITGKTLNATCSDDGKHCWHTCDLPNTEARNWRIPNYSHLMGWGLDGSARAHLQYSISCQAVGAPQCPSWIGGLTATLALNGITGVLGNVIDITCAVFAAESSSPKSFSNLPSSDVKILDRNAPLASLPENCQDGGWRNAKREIWERKYRNCPFPELQKAAGP